MGNERNFFKCSICGNIVGLIENGGGQLVCCGKPMDALVPNTVDAALEKHVPVAVFEDGKLKVTVGSVPHPMTAEHHIAWILVAKGDLTERMTLDPTGSPTAEFCVGEGPVTVYEYCNIHGLWKADIS